MLLEKLYLQWCCIFPGSSASEQLCESYRLHTGAIQVEQHSSSCTNCASQPRHWSKSAARRSYIGVSKLPSCCASKSAMAPLPKLVLPWKPLPVGWAGSCTSTSRALSCRTTSAKLGRSAALWAQQSLREHAGNVFSTSHNRAELDTIHARLLFRPLHVFLALSNQFLVPTHRMSSQ